VTIPAHVEDLTPEWFSEILDSPVRNVEILDAHSGTTGRARVGLAGSSDLPDTLFVQAATVRRTATKVPAADRPRSGRGPPVRRGWQ
jgi:hypothetical protein